MGVVGTLTRERWTGNDGQERASWSVVVDAMMSAQRMRPKGGIKRAEPKQGDTGRINDVGRQEPLNDEIPFQGW